MTKAPQEHSTPVGSAESHDDTALFTTVWLIRTLSRIALIGLVPIIVFLKDALSASGYALFAGATALAVASVIAADVAFRRLQSRQLQSQGDVDIEHTLRDRSHFGVDDRRSPGAAFRDAGFVAASRGLRPPAVAGAIRRRFARPRRDYSPPNPAQ